MGQYSVGKLPRERNEMLADDRPIFRRALVHMAEACLCLLVHRRSPRAQSRPNSSNL